MQLDFTGRQMEVTQELRKHTEERLRKLARILRGRFDAHVILAAEKHRRTAEITLKFRRFTLVGVEETADPLASINGAVDKIERQAVRRIDRKRTKKRRPKPAAAILVNVLGRPADREERRVLETERIPIKPLSIDEAIDSLDGARSGIVVFRNPDTERVNVIYRRHDGNLGMIEPEP
ncbi:MAG TPA: ribosome-associated translation inhibitor RaiA [Terriglobia bacterium]|nr:ribosome-associated translation inhibitor RaiA [Terriglobia bacterium]